jgi:cytidine deaminase
MTDQDLIDRATAARARAYAPYSRFQVGAALIAEGEIFDGANVENASYGLSVCAERTAILHAVLEGARTIEAIAIVSEISPPAAPCGMCLQTLVEFAPDPTQVRVLLANTRGEVVVRTLADYIPHAFTPEDLARAR